MDINTLTTKEVAEAFKVSSRTVQRWVDSGCPALKIGKTLRFEPQAVMDWVREQQEVKQ